MKRLLLLIGIFLIFVFQLYAYADEITFSSHRGDKVSILRDMKVDKKAAGNIVAVLGNLEINDETSGDVVVFMGNVTIDARVKGEVVTVFGKILLKDNAVVDKDVISIGTIEKADKARILGQEIAVNMGFLSYANAVFIVLSAVFSLFVLVMGFIIITVSGKRVGSIYSGMDLGFGRKFLTGFLVYVASTIFLPFLSITIVMPIAYVLLLLAAEIIVSLYIGMQLMKLAKSVSNMYLEFFCGFLIITAIKITVLALMPYAGYIACGSLYMLLCLIINSLGIGVLIDTRFGAGD